MLGITSDPMLMLPALHQIGKDDVDQHYFICESICIVNKIANYAMMIAHFDTTFIGRSLQCYMKYKLNTPQNQERTYKNIRRDLIKEFHKPKSE
jgi:hypothetical protein